MPTVFVVNKGAHDYTAAEKFGNLVYCTEGLLQKYATSQMVRQLSSSIGASNADDFILLTSLTTLCSIACAMFARKHGLLNLLIFKDDDYVSRKIVF